MADVITHRGGRRRIAAALLCAFAASTFTTTADAAPTIDGQFTALGQVGQTSTVNLTVVGRGGVPATGVDAVALNVTATGPSIDSFLTVWPAGAPRPTASNLNFVVGQTVPNMVIVPVGANGQISIFNNAGGVDVIVDVLGWFPTGGAYAGLTPARLMDTRTGGPTIDAGSSGTGPVGQTATVNLTIAGRAGVPASGVGAVALNITATNPTNSSFVTVWPAGGPRPTASNLNVVTGQTVPNMVIVPLGSNGQISMYNNTGSVDLIVDVLGWFPTGSAYTGLDPARLMDTRAGGPTIDATGSGSGPVGPAASVDVAIVGRGGVPTSGVGAVALNVTATGPTDASYVTAWPSGSARPTASNLNFVVGQTVPNMVIVPVGANGRISLYNNSGSVDLIVDVLGWFPIGTAYTGLAPARLMDTRPPTPNPPAAVGVLRNLLVARPALHQMSGTDRIAVWVCDVPANTTSADYSGKLTSNYTGQPMQLDVQPQAVASWAQQAAYSYFDSTSDGRLEITFTALGHIALSSTDGTSACLAKARALTGVPYSNVLATDNSSRLDGFGSPGGIASVDSQNYNVFTQPPSRTGRGFWIGGGSTSALPSGTVLDHEIGHTLHWPHSYLESTNEYDDPSDVMSGDPTYVAGSSTAGDCTAPYATGGNIAWPCHPQNTIAFNRFAAGWIDESQVRLQQSGTNTFSLDAPAMSGLQMVAAPDTADPHVMLTLEGRPRLGPDQYFGVEGVAVYLVDQRRAACAADFGGGCISTERRQAQAIGRPNTFDNILPVGSTTTIDGVTIIVSGKTGNAFTVQTSGTFVAPAPLPIGGSGG